MNATRRILAMLFGAGLCLSTAAMPAAAETTAAEGTQSSQLRVLTFNIWHSGAHGGISSVVDSIEATGANIVALQETDEATTARIAGELGWNHTTGGGDVDVIAALPIQNEWVTDISHGTTAVAAQIQNTLVYSVHLNYRDYGPYNACIEGDSIEQIRSAEHIRKQQAREIERWATSTYDLPQIIAGDFNTPSHLDWTPATRARHCGYVVDWPATAVFDDAGWRDSYRTAHPDEHADPGNTWSPVVKWHDDAQTVPEPQDRIDLILYEGEELAVSGSRVRGGGPDWPSDHYAVLSTFNRS